MPVNLPTSKPFAYIVRRKDERRCPNYKFCRSKPIVIDSCKGCGFELVPNFAIKRGV
jgi:hypothetical protein